MKDKSKLLQCAMGYHNFTIPYNEAYPTFFVCSRCMQVLYSKSSGKVWNYFSVPPPFIWAQPIWYGKYKGKYFNPLANDIPKEAKELGYLKINYKNRKDKKGEINFKYLYGGKPKKCLNQSK